MKQHSRKVHLEYFISHSILRETRQTNHVSTLASSPQLWPSGPRIRILQTRKAYPTAANLCPGHCRSARRAIPPAVQQDKGQRKSRRHCQSNPLPPRSAWRMRLREQAAQLGLLQVCRTSQHPRHLRGHARSMQSCVLPGMRALHGARVLANGSAWPEDTRDADRDFCRGRW